MVYYNYYSSGIGQTLSRLEDIADGAGGGRTKYARYDYFGAATIYKEEHPAVTGGLNLVYGAGDGTYSGLDRFGRVVDQLWQTDTPTVLDEYQYGYDYNSNRLYRKNVVAENASKAFDELYHADNPTAGTEYDGLNRLKEWKPPPPRGPSVCQRTIKFPIS